MDGLHYSENLNLLLVGLIILLIEEMLNIDSIAPAAPNNDRVVDFVELTEIESYSF